MAVINSIADREQDMKAWRHLLHQHPETSYEEVWTSDFIAAKLQSFGIGIHRGMGKTGVVGVLRGNGNGTAAIGLRADMDLQAVPDEFWVKVDLAWIAIEDFFWHLIVRRVDPGFNKQDLI